jgi:hypothetical protein
MGGGRSLLEHAENSNARILRGRILVSLVLAMLLAQVAFMAPFDEPYPAFVMPGFGGHGGLTQGEVEVSTFEAVFFTDRGEVRVPSAELLDEFPVMMHYAIARHGLTPIPDGAGNAIPDHSTRIPNRIASTLFPGYRYARQRRSSLEIERSLAQWLRGRARVLLPDTTVTRVEIQWFRERIRVSDGQVTKKRQPNGVFHARIGQDGS